MARIDKYLATSYPNFSRRQVQKLINEGKVRVNGVRVDPDFDFIEGMRLEVDWPRESAEGVVAEDLPLQVVVENSDFLVIDKPAGLVVHPGSGHSSGTVVNALLGHLDIEESRDARFGIVHRLDKDTSGLLLVAKNDETALKLKQLFRDREVQKEYLVLVSGRLPQPAGEINKPIGRHPRGGLRFAVGGGGKQAMTRYFTEKVYPKHTLLRVVPVTGRTHQIRVHLKSVGHPVVGDGLYGGEKLGRLFLHAARLSFRLKGIEYLFESALPEDLQRTLLQVERVQIG
jgi:23S rRNA pseudouridine1911/1915/1917 synthase